MATLNLVKKDTESIKDTRQIKLVNFLMESRSNYNELVDAFNSINAALTNISNKLDQLPVQDIEKSIDFNAETITDVQTKLMPALEAKMNANVKKVKADLTIKADEAVVKIEFLEGHSRRRNLIVNGIKEEKGENMETVVRQFLITNMKLEPAQVDTFLFRDMHRLPKAKKKDGTLRDGPRPVIVAFLRQKDRNTVMKKAFELKKYRFIHQIGLAKEAKWT